MERTGGTYSNHEHGGNCHVCGAHCLYTALFYHEPTNTYIRTGFDCAEKLDMGDARLFRSARSAVKEARHLKAGKRKAEITLTDAGCPDVWRVFNWTKEQYADSGMNPAGEWCYTTLCDIVGKLVKYGSLSEKQMAFVKSLANECMNFKAIKAEKERKLAEERANSEPCPTGRVVITGEIVSSKAVESYYGTQYKMLVKDDRGFKVWGTVPSAICGTKGNRVEFTATVEPSKDDEYFGFYKRPTKATETEVNETEATAA
jgi:hypothetical protein